MGIDRGFLRKQYQVKAVYINDLVGAIQNGEPVPSWIGRRMLGGIMSVSTNGVVMGMKSGAIDDYLVEDEGGILAIIPGKEFERLYEATGQPL